MTTMRMRVTDALRLSRGMSYKNAMAGLPLGGGKAVIIADDKRTKTPEMLHVFGKAVDHLCGRYVTAEDVGMSVADMIEIRRQTPFVAGLPVEGGDVGGDPGPHTSLGVFLGIKAAVRRALGKDSVNGLHIALAGRGKRRDRRGNSRCGRRCASVDRGRRFSEGSEARRVRPAGRSSQPMRSWASRPTC